MDSKLPEKLAWVLHSGDPWGFHASPGMVPPHPRSLAPCLSVLGVETPPCSGFSVRQVPDPLERSGGFDAAIFSRWGLKETLWCSYCKQNSKTREEFLHLEGFMVERNRERRNDQCSEDVGTLLNLFHLNVVVHCTLLFSFSHPCHFQVYQLSVWECNCNYSSVCSFVSKNWFAFASR